MRVLVPAWAAMSARESSAAWLIASIVLTTLVAGVLLFLILPAQHSALPPAAPSPRIPARLAMYTGLFNLLWATVTILMITAPAPPRARDRRGRTHPHPMAAAAALDPPLDPSARLHVTEAEPPSRWVARPRHSCRGRSQSQCSQCSPAPPAREPYLLRWPHEPLHSRSSQRVTNLGLP